MNILLINHYAGSPRHGMEYRPYYLAREWVKEGHRVTIIAASFSHLRTNNPVLKRGVTEESIDGIRYIWLKTPTYQGNGIGRIFNMLQFVIRLRTCIKTIIAHERIDAVIASSTYPLDIYPARLIQKEQKARLIFEVHDLWPLSPMELGNISAWHPYIMVMQKAENDAYRYCDQVVSILPCAAEHMIQHGLDPDRFVHVPHGITLEEQCIPGELPMEHKKILMNLKTEGRFLIGYTGAHGIANSLDTVIDAAKLCANQNIAFVLVGQGPEKEKLQTEVDQSGLSNVVFLPAVNKVLVPSILNFFDGCIIAWQKNRLYRFGISPNKLMDYMWAGKPVIHAVEAGNDPVKEAGCGISVPPEDPQAIADAIQTLAGMSAAEREAMGQRGKEYVMKHHDYKVIAKQFLAVFKK